TCMVLDMAEERSRAPVTLEKPVQALHDISDFKWDVISDNGTIHAVEIQRLYLDMARRFYGRADAATSYYLNEWERVLDALKDEPLSLAGELEWPTKMAILDGLDDGDKFDAHMRWHNIDPSRSLYHELRRTGDIRTCFSVDEIERASRLPPSNTRAHFRGEFVRRLPEDAKFQGVIDWGSIGGFCMPDPFNTYEAHMGEMDELIKRLLIPAPPN
ncbi:MAG: proteasome accessory factor PafA2 family protein, partial [Candidatus Aenigmarchaeota archaeon]|nr:proteasome accessory factor PafA2 family protein [Candidatus Aenigmarchaeota archaeon]